jgi:phage shock protein C
MLGGVCGGIADHFGMDPTIVRLLAVLLTLVGNAAVVIAYVVMWAVVPEEPLEGSAEPVAPTSTGIDTAAGTTTYSQDTPTGPPAPAEPPAATQARASAPPPPPPGTAPRRGGGAAVWIGIVLIMIGVAFLISRLTDITIAFWPVAFVGVLFVALGIKTIFTAGDDR